MLREDVLQYLKDNLYILPSSDGAIITNKFKRDIGARSTITKNSSIKQPARISSTIDTKERYKKFISDAEIPSKISNGNGGFFWGNRYSVDGEKAFNKVLSDSKIDEKILLAATKWYYKQQNTIKKMVGNFFINGEWESCYDDFVKAIEKHKIDNGGVISSIKFIDEDRERGRNSIRL